MGSRTIRRSAAAVGIALVAALALAGPAAAAPQPDPYQANDATGFHNILPAGANGFATLPDILSFLGSGARPPHSDDQLAMYRNLAYSTPGLQASQIGDFYKDASFGVKPDDVERTYTPQCSVPGAPQSSACGQVTIVRDKGYGVPHIYGQTRAGAMFGAGYVAAEDRLFFIDALRHAGRGELSSFAGGSNAEMDRQVWKDTPYNEADLQRQFDLGDDIYGQAGAQLQQDVLNYVDGVNQYIAEARVDPLKMPGEYAALGLPTGPADWKVTDVISTASLVAGIFGKGGGNEVNSALALEAAQQKFGARKGAKVWADFRSQNDPEAPTTVHKTKFPYEKVPKKVKGLALPDSGTVKDQQEITEASGTGGQLLGGGGLGFLRQITELGGNSNALLVSGKESQSGHPTAVFGPQVSYFNPQILMEEDIHAPESSDGPAIDARGASFPGTNLVVQLGRGRNYAWSATSADQDITDTFAVALCNPDGSAPTLDSDHYMFRGQCLPFEVLTRTNSWTPNPADQTAPGSETLQALRTKLGIVQSRALIHGKPFAYTKLRDTYFHEADSSLGFEDFNTPGKMDTPQEFMQAACKIDYTFNWFYINNKHIAYFNSGKNPVRAKNVNPNFPTMGTKRFEWKNFDPEMNNEKKTSCNAHPHVIDQRYLTSWNNKGAKKYSAADGNYSYQPLFRSIPLDDRIKARIRGSKRISLAGLVDSMEDAGTVDLRGDSVLPWMLKMIGTKKVNDPEVAHAVSVLSQWVASGAHRRDLNRDGVYDNAEAVRIMDAWWPRVVTSDFKPALGGDLFNRVKAMIGFDDAPNQGLGSAYISGWYGYMQKDLRTELGKKVKGRYSRQYCGNGHKSKCRSALISSLKDALANDSDSALYPNGGCNGMDAQGCADAIRYRATGAITQPPQPWVNRPTFQQVVQIP